MARNLPKCLDCNKQLKQYYTKRCRRCANMGALNPQFGKKRTLKTRKLTSLANKGKKPWITGKHHTEEWKKRMSLLKKGKPGKPLSEETKRKISLNNGAPKGAKHWNWKGGYKRRHVSSDWIQRRMFKREMQKLIFERDDYTCQLCGVRGVNLQVDHIQSWAEYVELRFSMDNCRTLCAKCHYKITFGREMPKHIKGWGHNILKRGDEL